MKQNDYIKCKVLREKSNWFMVGLFMICSIALLVGLSYRDTIVYNIDLDFKYNISARTLIVGPNQEIDLTSFKYDFETMKKIEHVEVVSKSIDGYPVKSSFKSSKYDGTLAIDHGNENIIKSLTGKELLGEKDHGKAICPEKFYPSSYKVGEENELNYYDEDLIGKTFEITYPVYGKTEDGKVGRIGNKTRSFKIVGLYDASKIFGLPYRCYIGGNEFEEIIHESTSFDYEQEEGIISGIRVIVDDAENIPYVQSELSKLNLKSDLKLFYDSEYISNVTLVIICIVLILIVFLVFISELYVRKKIIKNTNDIKLLYCLGFNKKDILNLYSINILVIQTIAYILSLIGLFILVLLNNYTPIDVSTISIVSIIITLFIMFIIPLMINRMEIKKLLANNQKLLLGDSE